MFVASYHGRVLRVIPDQYILCFFVHNWYTRTICVWTRRDLRDETVGRPGPELDLFACTMTAPLLHSWRCMIVAVTALLAVKSFKFAQNVL